MQIEMIPIGDLKPWANNPREIPESAVADLARYIDQVGFRDPVEVDGDTNIIAGHTRYLAVKRLDFELVPCIRHTDMTPDEVLSYRIASNKLAEGTDWSKALLADELSALDGAFDGEFSPHMLGFDDAELGKLFDISVADQELDTTPVAPKDYHTVQQGEIWDLGPHQLTIGSGHEASADAMIKAWQKKAKAKATLEGQSFAEVEKGRKFAAEGEA